MPTKESQILTLESDYLKRLKPWVTCRVIEGKSSIKDSTLRQKKDEEALLDLMKGGSQAILLDEHGKEFSTVALSHSLEQWQMQSVKKVILALGGADGWSEEMKRTVKTHWALSKLTFPYQLARLLLIEQLYRAFSIIHKSPYHRV